MKSLHIKGITFPSNLQECFDILNKLIFELRDFFANQDDKVQRPNFIDGNFNPIINK